MATLILNTSSNPVTLPAGLGGATLNPGVSTVVYLEINNTVSLLNTAGLLNSVGIEPYSRQPGLEGYDDINIYVSASSGNDSNSGASDAPFATLERAMSYTLAGMKSYHINLLAGTYNLPKTIYYHTAPIAPTGSAPVLIGSFTNILGTRTSTSASSTVLTDTTLNLRNGTAASIVTGAAAGMMRVTGVAGFAASDVGTHIRISGAASAGNNGLFYISAVNSATSIDVINLQAVVPDASNGALVWNESFEGLWIDVVSGAGNGQRRQIKSHTLTAFTLNNALSPAPSAGDQFKVEKPAVIINVTGSKVFDSGTFGIAGGIKFAFTNNAALTFRTQQNMWEGVEFDLGGTGLGPPTGGGALTITNQGACVVGQASQATAQWGNDSNLPFSSLRNGSGAFIHNGILACVAQSRLPGFFFVNACTLSVDFQSNFVPQNSVFLRTTATVQDNSFFQHTGSGGIWAGQVSTSATSGLLNVKASGVANLTGIDMSGSGGDAINVQTNGIALLGAVTGTGNAGVGITVDHHGYAQIDTTGANATTVTGTGGDTKFGHLTSPNTQTYTTVRTNNGGMKGFYDGYGNIIEA